MEKDQFRMEEEHQEKKLQRQMEIEKSISYRLIKGISTLMDKHFLDPIIGLFPGAGDVLSSLASIPFIYVSLFKVRSIPLTLAVLSNTLIDVLIGLIPFWIGDFCDCFYHSNLKNFKLITGFVEDDKEIIDQVNRRAGWMVVLIAVVCIAIYGLISLVASFFSQQ